jgi:CheY-like chemotaxis protein
MVARILFVDDDPMTLETLKRSVELFGHQSLQASSGEEAMQIARDHSPDLILTDMRLPDMDGLALVKAFKQDAATRAIPVVVLSASVEADVADLCRAVGADDFFHKPVRLQVLQDLIARYTGG